MQEQFLEKIKDIDPNSIYYIDETGSDQVYHSHYGYSKQGERCIAPESGIKGERISLVGGYNKNVLIAPMEISGTLKKIGFTHWFSQWLLPSIPAFSIIIMDNASIHDKVELSMLSAKANCQIIFLPPYSPQYNKIETLWANLKNLLRHLMTNCSLKFREAFEFCIAKFSNIISETRICY